MSSTSIKTIKQLFGCSGNICAFPKCPRTLIDEQSGSILAEICHIKGKKPNSARYDASQTDEMRDASENLILMCPIHHKIIDDDELSYTVERLQQIKLKYESRPTFSTQLNSNHKRLEELLERHLQLLVEEKQSLDDSHASIKEENSHLMKVRRLAKVKVLNDLRNEWFYSHEALNNVIDFVNKIFSLTGKHFAENPEYEQIGISLVYEKQSVSIVNEKFGIQTSLFGYDDLVPQRTSLNNLFLQLVLSDTTFYGQIQTKPMKEIVLCPDINSAKEVIWIDRKRIPMVLSAEDVSNKCFELLITQVGKGTSGNSSGGWSITRRPIR